MVFDRIDPRRVTAPEPVADDDSLTDEEVRLLADADFVAAFIAWRNKR